MLAQDIYREFLRAIRIWRHVQARKRSGQALGLGKVLPPPYEATISVLCPACPQPGLNITKADIIEHRDKPFVIHPNPYFYVMMISRHVSTLFMSGDADFKLLQRDRKNQKQDIYLMDGESYFPDMTIFKSYLKNAGEVKEVRLAIL